MVLEGAYGVFRNVTLVYVWGYELVIDIPAIRNDTLEFGAGLVVDNL